MPRIFRVSESRIFSNDERGDSVEEIEIQRRADHGDPEVGRGWFAGL